MAQKKSYSRYFIILQQDENGYSLASDKLPSGYTKLETKNDKCKITYYVQNLKKELEPYQMVLICSKKEMRKLVNLGNMTVDEYGRAEVSYEYNAANIADTSIPIEMVTGAAVVKHSNNKDMHSIMSGFITNDAPRDWKSFKSLDAEGTKPSLQEKPVKTPTISEEKPANIFDEYEKNIDTTQKDVSDKGKADQIDDNNKNVETNSSEQKIVENSEQENIDNKTPEINAAEEDNKEKDSKAEAEVIAREDIRNSEEIIEEPKNSQKLAEDKYKQVESESKEDKKVIENAEKDAHEKQDTANVEIEEDDKKTAEFDRGDKNKPKVTVTKGTLEKFFDDIAKDFKKVNPICEDIKRCDWYRVNVKSLEDMCDASDYNKYTVVYYPMISYYPYIKKYGHFLLGYKHDMFGNVKYLVYGIPGFKTINDQPYAGRSGFVTWAIDDVNREAFDKLGYWLMFYDFRNSTIVIPVQ
ncbi:hypothetical protein [Clostridium oryzae]|uniref:Transmembrane protein n=1 Tax=Clostridium oryzae TaxID=1450648 RepID=A0A1V4INB0_9CLOT|nr:hypothetical protein [Clostridium oryzae]OPJ61290.1 hypothetical protein CLORY_23300 [Clostridium oryzae]